MSNSASLRTDKEDRSRFKGNYVPGAIVLACKRGANDQRPENCVAAVEEVAGICGDGDPDACAGDWGERGGVQCAERAGAATDECAARAKSLHGAAFAVPVAVVSRLSGSAG